MNGRFDIRLFRGDENLTYANISLHFGLGEGAEGILRGSFAPHDLFALPSSGFIAHGGSDLEIMVKQQLKGSENVAWMVGMTFNDSPAQSDGFLTLGVVAGFGSGDVTYSFNPRAIMIQDNTLVGLGFGLETEISSGISFVGDFTALVSGDNTRSVTTGAAIQRNVYGAVLRFDAKGPGKFGLDLGYTNAVGNTTGFGMTPSLGDKGTFFVAVSLWR